MKTGVRRAVAGAAAALVLSIVAHGQVVKPTFDEEFEKARTLLSRREYFEALKGFQKVALAAGASAPVHLELDARAFAYWSTASNDWRVAPGCYQILLGRSARAIVATASVPLGGGTCP